MKKFLTLFAICIGISYTASAQTVVQVKDSISQNTTWQSCKQYLLNGYVYVTKGTTLTIEPGTIIKGDKETKGALIVERGAKIIAQGTVDRPIVFTSNQAAGNRTYGDWGGIIICGKAPNNWNGGVSQVEGGPRSLYGGTDPHDNSGILSFVRIEFGGIAFSPNNEVNGLTLCSVGDQTQLDHIQVSYSGDDSYEWFGGSVNAKYLISYRTWDDDFDTDNGYRGKNQFCVVLRDPYAADQSGSKAFESDSYQSGTKTGLGGDTSGLTKPMFTNCTIVGPIVNTSSSDYDPQFVSGLHVRRGSALSFTNSLLMGFPAGILFDESSSSFGSTVKNLQDSIAIFRNNAIAGIPSSGSVPRKEFFYAVNGARSLTPTTTEGDTTSNNAATGNPPFSPYAGPYSMFRDTKQNKLYASQQNGLRLSAPFNLSNPSFIPTSTSPVVFNNTALPAYVKSAKGNDPFKNGGFYPYNPNMPINKDTTNYFAHYNAPDLPADFSNKLLQDNFFDKVSYIGAFKYTGSSNDNWMAKWTNFDPVNTDYSAVNNAPLAQVDPANTATVCKTKTIVLSAGSGSGLTYQWKNNGVDINGATNATLTVSDSGHYAVTVTSTCGSATSPATAVTVSDLPTADFTFNTTTSGVVNFTNNSGNGASTYVWNFGDGTNSNSSSPQHVYSKNGTYTVELIAYNSSNCTDTTNKEVSITTLGISNMKSVAGISMYPNPTHGLTTLRVELTERTDLSVSVYDITGQKAADIMNNKMDAGTHMININTVNYHSGVYFVKLTSAQGDKMIRLVHLN